MTTSTTRAATLLMILLVGSMSLCAADVLECPPESLIKRSAPHRVSEPLDLPANLAAIAYGLHAPTIAIDAEFDASGHLSCASPLAGHSIYWPYAIAFLTHVKATLIRQVFE